MKTVNSWLTIILLFIFSAVCGQISEPVLITHLDEQAEETSGLILVDASLWTHNDSGGEAKLYCIDTITGNVTRTVIIRDAENNDWEDICKDDNYIYIGDFGNNSGARDDLKIYRISISDLRNESIDTANCEIISFSYSSDIYNAKYTHRNNTNFDCEAMISFEDSLYLFSKNWIDKQTYSYALPKTPGDYIATLRDTLNCSGLICGADYCAETNTIALIGYIYGIPAPSIMLILSDFSEDNFFDGTVIRKELSLDGCQTEGIVFRSSNVIWFSNESFLSYTQSLFFSEIITQDISETNSSMVSCKVFPNPANDKINITFPCEKRKCQINVEIFDSTGHNQIQKTLCLSEKSQINELDISILFPGTYIISLRYKDLYFRTRFINL